MLPGDQRQQIQQFIYGECGQGLWFILVSLLFRVLPYPQETIEDQIAPDRTEEERRLSLDGGKDIDRRDVIQRRGHL